MKNIKVVCGIYIEDGKVLVSKRNYGFLKDHFEFIGGKVENNEDPKLALKREMLEEVNTIISVKSLLCETEYCYENEQLNIKFYSYLIDVEKDDIKLSVHDDIHMHDIDKLDELTWCPADIEIVSKVKEIYAK